VWLIHDWGCTKVNWNNEFLFVRWCLTPFSTIFHLYLLYAKQQWPWSYGSWIYNYLCNQYLSPLILWIWISIMARCTTLCDKVCKWLATGRWFSPVSSNNKTDRHDISEILLKMAYHIMLYTSPWSRFKFTISVVIGTDCIGSCKFNYHTITAIVV
jgi:hypothetical protein